MRQAGTTKLKLTAAAAIAVAVVAAAFVVPQFAPSPTAASTRPDVPDADSHSGFNATVPAEEPRIEFRPPPIGLMVVGTSDERPGVLVIDSGSRGGAAAEMMLAWVPDIESRAVDAVLPRPEGMVAAARAPDDDRPTIASLLPGGSIALQRLGAASLESPELVALTSDQTDRVNPRIMYEISGEGTHVIGGSFWNDDSLWPRTRLLVKSPESAWTALAEFENLELRDWDLTGSTLHLLLVGPTGTYYASADVADHAGAVHPELAIPPGVAWGVRLDAASDGRLAIAAAEPQEESELPPEVPDLGIRIAIRDEGGWQLQPTYRVFAGSYVDVRVEPSLRILLPIQEKQQDNATAIAYAPAGPGEPWSESGRLSAWGVAPQFIDGSPFVMSSRAPAVDGWWFDLVPLK